MDTISALITHIKLERQESLPISTPTPPSSESNITKQEPPDITNTPTGDIPPPHFISSINELRSISTALSAFLTRYDELHNHLTFIKSSIDSKLPNHLVDTANPNQPALTHLVDTSSEQSIIAVPEVIVSEQNPNATASDCERSHENAWTPESTNFSQHSEDTDTSKKPEVVDVWKNPEEIDVSKKPVDTNTSKKPKEIDTSKKPEEIDVRKKPEEIEVSNKPEEIDVSKNHAEIDISKKPEGIVTLKKPEETVPETSCDQTVAAAPEAIVSEQNPNGTATNCERSRENVRAPESLEEIYVSKKPEEIDISKKPEQTDVSKNPEEIDIMKKPEQSDISKNPEEIDTSKKHEEIDVTKKHEVTDILKKAEEIDVSKKPKETVISKKPVRYVLELLCKNMCSRELKKHIATHISEMNKHREDIAKALKLAKDPAKLVLNSIGRFFVQGSRAYCKGSHQHEQIVGRLASVLILECFVMISSDGIKIAKRDEEYAADAAVDWRKRVIKEGGLGHMDEVDARGLLLFISGYGIQDHVFKIEDIRDLIRASNVKGISTALRRSMFLIPKIPDVIDLMVKNNLEIEAADIAYTFGLEDKCHPQTILLTFLHNRIKDVQNVSSFQVLAAMEEQLFDLKSVKQCLETHNVDPSKLLPHFNINEKIKNLEKDINEGKLIQKRKSLGNPIHQEAKRACFRHENVPHKQKPLYNWSTQPSSSYFDFDRSLPNNYITTYSASSVYNASLLPENINDSVASGFPGSSDHMVHVANDRPYGWHGPYGQPYSRQGQPYDSQPYGRPSGWVPEESFPGFSDYSPSGGFPGRRGPSSDLYSFADIVEKESLGVHTSGSGTSRSSYLY